MSTNAIRIAVIGLGKIAGDQHIPSIAENGDFHLAATVSPHHPGIEGIAHFKTLDALLATGPTIDAVALCTPPQIRYNLAAQSLAHGLGVFLEKPPGATLSEVAALVSLAKASGATLFASWHSRFAAGVAPAKEWLAGRTVRSAKIVWREDVRVWHPGQAWIWEPGGLGVFDPGINALSIATHILPNPFFLTDATLCTPANREAPIAANLQCRDTRGAPVTMDLDWRQTGPQSWDIIVETEDGTLALANGGAVLTLPAGSHHSDDREYAGLYAHFARLMRARQCDVDTDPMRLVADAFLRARRATVEAFDD